jgi:hypothetical protein
MMSSRVLRVLHPQRDPQVGVRLDVGVDAPGGPLGGEHQVDPQAAAPLGDADQRAEEVGQLGGERRELVDDDDQPGQRPGGDPDRR